MEDYKITLSKEEYDIIKFYRQLPSNKQKKFLKLLASLRKILLDEKDA